MQSVDQLLKAAAQFAIKREELVDDIDLMKKVFEARNQITHEMDVQLNAAKLSRRARKEEDILKVTNTLIETSQRFIAAVYNKL